MTRMSAQLKKIFFLNLKQFTSTNSFEEIQVHAKIQVVKKNITGFVHVCNIDLILAESIVKE